MPYDLQGRWIEPGSGPAPGGGGYVNPQTEGAYPDKTFWGQHGGDVFGAILSLLGFNSQQLHAPSAAGDATDMYNQPGQNNNQPLSEAQGLGFNGMPNIQPWQMLAAPPGTYGYSYKQPGSYTGEAAASASPPSGGGFRGSSELELQNNPYAFNILQPKLVAQGRIRPLLFPYTREADPQVQAAKPSPSLMLIGQDFSQP